MARIPRIFQKIFAGNYASSPSGQIAQFGSLAAGAAQYTANLTTLQALDNYSNGWLASVVGSKKSPTAQDFNALFYMLTTQIAYLMQMGVAEYDNTTEYETGSLCISGGILYVSLVDGNVGLGTYNANAWIPLTSSIAPKMPGVAKAWAHFTDNGAGVVSLVTSYNVDSISVLGTGNYLINIPSGILKSQSYAYSFASEQNDSTGSAQILTRFTGDIKTATQFQFRSVNATDSQLYFAREGAVTIFHQTA